MEAIYTVSAMLVLLGALIYGMIQYSRRSRSAEKFADKIIAKRNRSNEEG